MRKFIEKSLVIIFCLFNTYKVNPTVDLVYYFLISLIISIGLDLLSKRRIRFFFYLVFLGLIVYDSLFIYYFPLILYNLYIDLNFHSLLAIPVILNENTTGRCYQYPVVFKLFCYLSPLL